MQHETHKPLTGCSGWIITDGKAGMDVQARGVADALGLHYEMKRVMPRGLWRLTAPWGPVAPNERPGRPGSAFSPPWPAVAIATGRASIPYIRAIRRAAGAATFTVVLQDPKTGPATADLIWVPEHDKRRGANVLTTLTAPHSFTQERLASLRAAPSEAIAALPKPRIAVVLGGKNAVPGVCCGTDGPVRADRLALVFPAHRLVLLEAATGQHHRPGAYLEFVLALGLYAFRGYDPVRLKNRTEAAISSTSRPRGTP